MNARRDRSVFGWLGWCGVWVALGWCGVSSWGVDREALRSLVGVPSPSFEMAFAWNTGTGFVVGDPLAHGAFPERDLEAERRSLEAQLAVRPEDDELWTRLREVQGRRGDTNAAVQAGVRAEKLLRAQLASQPTNGWLHARLGATLFLPEGMAEMERLFGEAVRLAPDDDRTWRALADFEVRASCSQFGTNIGSFEASVGDLGALSARARTWLEHGGITAEQRNEALRRVRRGREALQRASRVSRPGVESLMARWTYETAVAPMLESMYAGSPPPAGVTPAMLDRGLLGNLRQAAMLSSNVPYALGMAMSMLTAAGLAEAGPEAPEVTLSDLRGLLPAEDRAFFGWVNERLEVLAQPSSPRVAAEAWVVRGFLEMFVLGNRTNAAALALRGAELDPNHVAALPLAMVCLSNYGDHEGAARVADTLVRRRDSVTARAMRAKVLARAKRYEEAEADLRRVLELESTNVMARVGLATLEVLRDDREKWSQAASTLGQLENDPALAEDRTLRQAARMARAAALAWLGQVGPAKRALYSILAESPTDPDARKALEAIERQ